MSSNVWQDPSVVSAVADLQQNQAFLEGDESGPPAGGLQPLEFDSRRSAAPAKEAPSRPAPPSSVPTAAFALGTLDEPITDTILRDLRQLGAKIAHVMMPYESQVSTLEHLRDWDLWGPLFIGLLLAILLSMGQSSKQASTVFSLVFVIIWVGAAVVTLNASLLGGTLSFWQSVCVLGYSVFPLCVARLVILFLHIVFSDPLLLIKWAIVAPAFVWSTKVSVMFIGEAIVPERRALAVYPVLGFYAWLAWLVAVAH